MYDNIDTPAVNRFRGQKNLLTVSVWLLSYSQISGAGGREQFRNHQPTRVYAENMRRQKDPAITVPAAGRLALCGIVEFAKYCRRLPALFRARGQQQRFCAQTVRAACRG